MKSLYLPLIPLLCMPILASEHAEDKLKQLDASVESIIANFKLFTEVIDDLHAKKISPVDALPLILELHSVQSENKQAIQSLVRELCNKECNQQEIENLFQQKKPQMLDHAKNVERIKLQLLKENYYDNAELKDLCEAYLH